MASRKWIWRKSRKGAKPKKRQYDILPENKSGKHLRPHIIIKPDWSGKDSGSKKTLTDDNLTPYGTDEDGRTKGPRG
jgi:hypothetical protein